jgi:hypothetical protein
VRIRNLILLWPTAGVLMTGLVFAGDNGVLRVAPRAGSTAGGLNVRSPLLPGDNFDFRSCEGVVYGDKAAQSTGLFLVKVSGDPAVPGVHWTFQDNTYSYQWKYAEGIKVDFAATPDRHSLKLRYTITNDSQAVLPRVILHTCVPTTEAPSFFPPRLEHAGTDRDGKPTKFKAYLSLYDRVFLWSKGKRFAFSETESGKDEVHLAFGREGAPPTNWAWWKNGKETFDVPLIAVASKDGQFTVGLGFQDGIWASSNTGDDRACFHLFPNFGTLKPGESATVEGRFYFLQGGPDAVLAQFRRDFPR